MTIKTVKVSGVEYNVAQVSAVQQFRILTKITKAGASSVLAALAVNDDVNLNQIGAVAIAAIFERVSDEDIQDICQTLLACVRRKGDHDPIEIEDFQGNMSDYMMLVVEVLKVNYQDFTKLFRLVDLAGAEETTANAE